MMNHSEFQMLTHVRTQQQMVLREPFMESEERSSESFGVVVTPFDSFSIKFSSLSQRHHGAIHDPSRNQENHCFEQSLLLLWTSQ